MNTRNQILNRIKFAYLGIVIFSLAIVLRILFLQFFEKQQWYDKQNQISEREITIEANRGDIYADDNRLLASSVPFYELRMDLKTDGLTEKIFDENIDSLAYYLSDLFKDKTKTQYKDDLIKARLKGNRYKLIRRKATFIQLKALKTFPIFNRGKYKGGLIIRQENIRIQPFGNLASRTIGRYKKGRNIVGVEGAYDAELRGTKGIQLMQKLSGGIWMPVRGGTTIEAIDGNDVITTINVNIQDVAESALFKQLIKHDAHHGTAVVMEVKTGEIKAIANLKRTINGNYKEYYNYAIGESAEPGSTFKLASLIIALEDGNIKLSDTVDTKNGEIEYYGQSMKDSHDGGYGKITVQEVFEKSSNVGVSKIITDNYKSNPSRFVDRLYQMNLNEKLGVEFRGEGAPKIIDPTDTLWSGLTLPWMSIGYSVQITPLQTLAFYNAIANNGRMVKPKFVKELRYRGETVKRFDTEILNPSICSKQTIESAKEMLLGVVERGTATNLKNKNYKIAGKTGTTQLANKSSGYGQNSTRTYQASFVGYFPADDPQYTCIIVVNNPSSGVYYGNLVAGPVFKEIADKIYASSFNIGKIDNTENLLADAIPYSRSGYKDDITYVLNDLNISKIGTSSKWINTQKLDTVVKYFNNRMVKGITPNVRGMGLRDAIFLLENRGFEVTIIGKGVVKYQSVSAGEKYNKGDKIILKLI